MNAGSFLMAALIDFTTNLHLRRKKSSIRTHIEWFLKTDAMH